MRRRRTFRRILSTEVEMQGKRRVRRHAWLVGALLLVCFCGLAASQSRRYKSGRRPPHRNTSAKMSARTALPERVQLEVASSTILGVTSMPYVCVTMDWWPETKCDWGFCGGWTRGSVLSLDLQPGSNDRRDLTLALSSLAPAALRVGGSLQDIISYETEFEACGPYQSTKDRVGYVGGCLTADRYDQLDDIAREAGAPLVFGVSGLHGYRKLEEDCVKCTKNPCEPCYEGAWQSNAGGSRALLQRAAARSATNRSALAALSLGNELCGIGGIAAHLSPEEVARDFVNFASEVENVWKGAKCPRRLKIPTSSKDRPMIVGPDCQLPMDSLEAWLGRFLAAGGGEVIDAFTYHIYWLGAGGNYKKIRSLLIDRERKDEDRDPRTRRPWPSDRAFEQRVAMHERIARAGAPEAQIWVSESGGAYGSGAINVTDTFVSSFWYLDELARLAARSTALHCRQTLVGGNYALLRRRPDTDRLEPNPDYFATRLFAAFMGARSTHASLNSSTKRFVRDVRTYAHCRLASRRDSDRFGDLTLLIINSASRRPLIVDLPSTLRTLRREEYHVTAAAGRDGSPNLDGRFALLNGIPLATVDQIFEPINTKPGDPLNVEPASYSFIIFRNAHWPALPAGSEDDLCGGLLSVSECLHADEEWTWRRDVFEKRSSAEATSLEVTAMRRRGVKWRGPRDGLQVEIELLWEPENTEKSVYATKGSTVYVHYTGRLSSGAVFDATRSKSDGTPFRFVVGGGKVTDGFERGVSMTRLGCVSRIRVANAYPRGVPGSIEPGASLVFDVFVAQVDDEKADEEPPVLVRGEPADLLSDSWGPSKETRSFASFTRKNKDVQEVGKPVPRRKKNSTAWTGTDDVSSTGLCVVEDALGDLESMLLARWTWSELCESDWANEQLGLAKYKAPIDSNKDKLIDCPVVEIPLADFARYCLRLARDDNSAFNEARYYLNGWEPLANEDARVWGGGPMPQIDNFPHVQDLSRRLLLEYEKQTNARLFGSKDTNAASLAEKTADSASKHLTKAFVGPTGSTTRLHQDNHGAHARLTVLKGRKLYVAFSPLDEEYLYVQNGHSSVDFLDPDLEEYPLYARATPYAAIVEEGQTLLVPKNWFHAAVSLTPTLTIMRNFWTVSNLQDFSDMQSSQLRRKLALLREAGLIRSA